MAAPLYATGDQVYVKESAQVGFLEAMTIDQITSAPDGVWLYTIVFGPKLPTAPTFGDRVGYQAPRSLYYNESELVSFCDAAAIVEEALAQRLAEIRQQRAARC